jgi:hypothetical protein
MRRPLLFWVGPSHLNALSDAVDAVVDQLCIHTHQAINRLAGSIHRACVQGKGEVNQQSSQKLRGKRSRGVMMCTATLEGWSRA